LEQELHSLKTIRKLQFQLIKEFCNSNQQKKFIVSETKHGQLSNLLLKCQGASLATTAVYQNSLARLQAVNQGQHQIMQIRFGILSDLG
jgi:hypothetical protein